MRDLKVRESDIIKLMGRFPKKITKGRLQKKNSKKSDIVTKGR